jgi:hypothetical protein
MPSKLGRFKQTKIFLRHYMIQLLGKKLFAQNTSFEESKKVGAVTKE